MKLRGIREIITQAFPNQQEILDPSGCLELERHTSCSMLVRSTGDQASQRKGGGKGRGKIDTQGNEDDGRRWEGQKDQSGGSKASLI